ncbi:MAG: murein L,D-transpeptidase catalytic domain family protein [Lysobacteraceae bacterium]
MHRPTTSLFASLLATLALTTALSASAADAGRVAISAPLHQTHTNSASSLLGRLQRLAPEANPKVIALALEAAECAAASGVAAPALRLAVIDYSRPSTERRLWVFDLKKTILLYAEYVAHGRNSGENFANAFSNRESSHQSSLGLFATAETYTGGNGYSLRMDGLEPGINDQARARAIVMHGAPYVDPVMAQRQGRLGRSFGCPAVRPAVANDVIDTLKQGQLVFAYYPDQQWLANSRFFRCGANRMAGIRPQGSHAAP